MIGSEKTNLQEFVYKNLRRGNWDEVVRTYGEEAEARGLRLTQSGDTALHLAVFDNQQQVVEKLLNQLVSSGRNQQQVRVELGTENDRGDTPLHMAAAVGSAPMCHLLASRDCSLVDHRNKNGETPLFLAALHANKEAFYCLYHFCASHRFSSNCRRNPDGDTALHCALRNQQFDLAFHIISAHKDAANWVDMRGIRPLHVLATKPTAFRSGTFIKGWWRNIVYCFTICNFKQRLFKKKRNLGLNDNDKAKSDADLEKDGRVGEESANFDTHEHPSTRLLEADHEPLSASEPKVKYFPENYSTCVDFFKIIFTGIFIILGFRSNEIRKIRQKKEKHTWSVQVMEKLLELTSPEKYFDDGNTPMVSKLKSTDDETETLPYTFVGDQIEFNTKQTQDQTGPAEKNNPEEDHIHTNEESGAPKESEMLLAAKHGVVEMVRRLFKHFPQAIRDTNAENKNVVLLAAEYRQPDVYKFLYDNRKRIENVFRAVDDKGNSALHLAANAPIHKPWRINGAALQMQWELKWYQFVKESMPSQFFASDNKEGRLPKQIFHESHKDMVKNGSQWLTSTSTSCSLVATLITTVAFASATTIPGGNGDNGTPPLEKELGFLIFALSSLVALCLSTTSVITFLGILTSRFDDKDFRSNLPWKLLIGLSSLFFSIVAMLASFFAGHFFLLHYRLRNTALVVYTVVCIPVATLFAIAQLPLYYDLLISILRTVPRRSAQVIVSNKFKTPIPQNACSNCGFKDTAPQQCCKCKTE